MSRYGEEQLGIIDQEWTDSDALTLSQDTDSISKPLFVYTFNVTS